MAIPSADRWPHPAAASLSSYRRARCGRATSSSPSSTSACSIQKMFEKRLTEPVAINCGLIAFTVRGGVASADPILIDTKKNVILGRGSFNFKDERLDIAMRADGKKFSLFSGQSPVGVGGYSPRPRSIDQRRNCLRAAVPGPGMGAVLSPLAAILAFVDGRATPSRRPVDRFVRCPCRCPAHQQGQTARRCRPRHALQGRERAVRSSETSRHRNISSPRT